MASKPAQNPCQSTFACLGIVPFPIAFPVQQTSVPALFCLSRYFWSRLLLLFCAYVSLVAGNLVVKSPAVQCSVSISCELTLTPNLNLEVFQP